MNASVLICAAALAVGGLAFAIAAVCVWSTYVMVQYLLYASAALSGLAIFATFIGLIIPSGDPAPPAKSGAVPPPPKGVKFVFVP